MRTQRRRIKRYIAKTKITYNYGSDEEQSKVCKKNKRTTFSIETKKTKLGSLVRNSCNSRTFRFNLLCGHLLKITRKKNADLSFI